MAAALAAAPALFAQDVSPGPLDFLGFRPGVQRAEAAARVRALGGSWRCSPAKVDRRVEECRGTLPPRAGGFDLIGSVIDGSVAVLLFSTPTDDVTLAAWVEDLAHRFGRVEPRRSHSVEVWQWTRRQRMIRVTTRHEGGTRYVSVSLVDGPLLDSLDGG